MTRTSFCRHCGQPMPALNRAGVYLPAMKGQIFDVIKKSPGIGAADIAMMVYGDSSPKKQSSIRVHIAHINDMLAATKVSITGNGVYKHKNSGGYGRGEYRIVERK